MKKTIAALAAAAAMTFAVSASAETTVSTQSLPAMAFGPSGVVGGSMLFPLVVIVTSIATFEATDGTD